MYHRQLFDLIRGFLRAARPFFFVLLHRLLDQLIDKRHDELKNMDSRTTPPRHPSTLEPTATAMFERSHLYRKLEVLWSCP